MPEKWTIVRVGDESLVNDLMKINAEAFSRPWTREMFLDELRQPERSFLLGALSESHTVVGYCSVWRVLDNLQINSIAVSKRCRGRGIGITLLNAVLSLGNKLGAVRILLEVRSSNAAARALYRRLAFIETGVRSGYYSQPVEDAVILSRCLESARAV